MEKNDDITLSLIVRLIRQHRRLIIPLLLLVAVGAVEVVRLLPRRYHSECILFPVEQSYVAASMKLMGTSLGVNVGEFTRDHDAFYPVFYPEFVYDARMQNSLLRTVVRPGNKGRGMTYAQYLRRHHTPLAPADTDALRPSAVTDSLVKAMNKKLKLMVDTKTYVITIEVVDADAFVASEVCRAARQYLYDFIADYRKKKVAGQAAYYRKIEGQHRQNYETSWAAYCRYADTHTNPSQPGVEQRTQQLLVQAQNNRALMEAVKMQRINAEARVSDTTPPFITIQHPAVAPRKEGVDRLLFVVGVVFLAFTLMLLGFLYKPIVRQLK